ncbi:hypothetical protein L6164_013274 [Bauhinia variegata]|uniref:Uncharacterized protein n=1 Tax=Bauhinia variegata TaxID=167791 RepID=A0ACB9PDQ9_BAUVA|nr:hypothetical protein L6164_013274 [Bauhinia variegata]
MNITNLPEECISQIISYTSPKDACRCSLVNSALRAVADSDDVWESFLPSDYKEIISQSSSPHLISLYKKSLFFHLCDQPVLLADNIMAFSMEKQTGKKCYMLGSRGLGIIWVDHPQYWKWKPMSESRFSQVVELDIVWWLEVWGRLETKLLSPNTTYGVFFVYKFGRRKRGFRNRYVQLKLEVGASENESCRSVILDIGRNVPQPRNDGWNEVEMGEFFNEHGEDGSVVARLVEFDENAPLQGLIVEGIEFRPKDTE